MSYEIHITYALSAPVSKIVSLEGWSKSKIDGDPVLGAGVKHYFTKHTKTLSEAETALKEATDFLEVCYGVVILRTKIEHIVHDQKPYVYLSKQKFDQEILYPIKQQDSDFIPPDKLPSVGLFLGTYKVGAREFHSWCKVDANVYLRPVYDTMGWYYRMEVVGATGTFAKYTHSVATPAALGGINFFDTKDPRSVSFSLEDMNTIIDKIKVYHSGLLKNKVKPPIKGDIATCIKDPTTGVTIAIIGTKTGTSKGVKYPINVSNKDTLTSELVGEVYVEIPSFTAVFSPIEMYAMDLNFVKQPLPLATIINETRIYAIRRYQRGF